MTAKDLPQGIRQEQFLQIIDRFEAAARFNQHISQEPLGVEVIPLGEALDRTLGTTVAAPVDVPGFDRASVDGFAVWAADTFGACDAAPAALSLNDEILSPGMPPAIAVLPGTATPIATGGMVPRGADAVVMIEHTEVASTDDGLRVLVRKPALPGQFIAFAGTDVARGETVLRRGQLLTSREIGVLAAIGLAGAAVYRKPRVAILSTGNEIIPPGAPPRAGFVFDSNGAILSAAVREAGGEPIPLGIVPDDEAALEEALDKALAHDVVLLSGGTSKGIGDLSYRCVARLENPGIVAHGVALKPGKPICLAVTNGKPVVVLPGFPTSAIFNFHEFIAPVIRRFAGRTAGRSQLLDARLPVKIQSELGRAEYVLVNLLQGREGLAAYPTGKGSGTVTAFSCADGFITIDQQTEFVPAGSTVKVQLIGQKLEPADLVFVGSQCAGLDALMNELQDQGLVIKTLFVGSMGGVTAARRRECDLAGTHLMDPETGEYNKHLLSPGLRLIEGYKRMQGVVFRKGDARFEGKSAAHAVETVSADLRCTMVNRNAGSGTRVLIDRLLQGRQPPGHAVQPKSHNAVAAAVAQGRADWGVAIDTVARQYDLGFLPLKEEHYDFIVPEERLERSAVREFLTLLHSAKGRCRLAELGFGVKGEGMEA
jgi:putative molybdopterin biosynthesis protein